MLTQRPHPSTSDEHTAPDSTAPQQSSPARPTVRHRRVHGASTPRRRAAGRALMRSLDVHPLRTLGLLGLALLLVSGLQAGMSERLRLTWHLANAYDRAVSATMPGAGLFRAAVSWVPQRLPVPLPGASTPASSFLMAMVGYVAVVALSFALYGLALAWVARRPAGTSDRSRRLFLIGTVGALCSTLLLFTPAAPSHDPFAYAMSGRLLVTYHANPFFVVPSAYPHDPILAADEWRTSATAYGPLWAYLSALLTPLVGADPLRANFVYRLVAYAAQLLNLLLIPALLRQLPARFGAWQERGLLLYAWNPLVLIELAAGHNDVAMLTLLLLGLFLMARGRPYAGAVALGAAILLKASAWPLVLVFLLSLWLREQAPTRRPALIGRETVGVALALAGTVVVGYLPFYWGHSLAQIAASSRLQPASQQLSGALTSSFGTLATTIASLRLPSPLALGLEHGALLLNSPTFWTLVLGVLWLAVTFLLLPALAHGERLPAALAWVYAVWMVFLAVFHLLRTWYLIPLVGLVSLAPVDRPIRRFVLVLTATMQLDNLFLSRSPPFDGWQPWTLLLVVGIPIAVLVVELRRAGWAWRPAVQRSLAVLRVRLGWPRVARMPATEKR